LNSPLLGARSIFISDQAEEPKGQHCWLYTQSPCTYNMHTCVFTQNLYTATTHAKSTCAAYGLAGMCRACWHERMVACTHTLLCTGSPHMLQVAMCNGVLSQCFLGKTRSIGISTQLPHHQICASTPIPISLLHLHSI
jgi:hypothetical protein